MADMEIPTAVMASGTWTVQIGPDVVGSSSGDYRYGDVQLFVAQSGDGTYVWYGVNYRTPNTPLPAYEHVKVSAGQGINFRYSVPSGQDMKFVIGAA